MSKRNRVAYTKPPEPSFIREMKDRVGYKEGPTVDTKKQHQPADDDDADDERQDEQPTVVVLEEGDLTKEEADRIRSNEPNDKNSEEKEDNCNDGGRILFKKPKKRTCDDESEGNEKKVKASRKKSDKGNKSDRKAVKNASLLSFDEDDE